VIARSLGRFFDDAPIKKGLSEGLLGKVMTRFVMKSSKCPNLVEESRIFKILDVKR
jgi:hypothetical protein